MEQPISKQVDYTVFNRFQTMFYTNIKAFESYTYFEIKQNSFILLNNIIKGLPHLANEIMNIYSPHVKIFESPAIILALQRRFVNNFNNARVPQYIYYKAAKVKPESKRKVKEIKLNGVTLKLFPPEVNSEIMTILMLDSKTFDYLKYSEKIQFLGTQLMGEIEKKEDIKAKKSRKKLNAI